MTRLDIRTLGPLQVRRDGRTLDLGARKQRAVFAILVANRRSAVSADRIVEALWGPTAADGRRQDVWVYVSRLRKALGPDGDVLDRNGVGYVIDVADEAVDAYRFEALLDEARQLVATDPAKASSVLAKALATWSGDPFGEFAGEDFVAAEVARLDESRLMAIEMRLEAELAIGNGRALIPEVYGLIVKHPLRARLVAGLMLALYRQGRQADALVVYQDFAKRLAEMGLQPPPDVRVLEEQILVDDPALQPISPTVASRRGSTGDFRVV